MVKPKNTLYGTRNFYTATNPIDMLFDESCIFRGPLDKTMRKKPHYQLKGGCWYRFFTRSVYSDFIAGRN